MEIRKADSKGRVTGFEPGRYYEIVSSDHEVVILSPVATKAEIAELGPGAMRQLQALLGESGVIN